MAGLSLGLGLSLSGGASAAAAWAPASLGASLLAFWDAEGAGVTTVSGAVSSWADSTANAYALTQGTAGQRPAFSATSFNGRPGVTFTKASFHNLQRAGIGSLPINADPCEIWVLLDQTLAAGDTAIGNMFNYGASANGFRATERNVATGVNRGAARVGTGAAATLAQNANVDFSGKMVLRVSIGATTTRVDVNGTAGTGVSIVPATASGNMVMGRSPSGSNYFQGVLNAVLVTGALDTDQAANLLAFLKARGGIA